MVVGQEAACRRTLRRKAKGGVQGAFGRAGPSEEKASPCQLDVSVDVARRQAGQGTKDSLGPTVLSTAGVERGKLLPRVPRIGLEPDELGKLPFGQIGAPHANEEIHEGQPATAERRVQSKRQPELDDCLAHAALAQMDAAQKVACGDVVGVSSDAPFEASFEALSAGGPLDRAELGAHLLLVDTPGGEEVAPPPRLGTERIPGRERVRGRAQRTDEAEERRETLN